VFPDEFEDCRALEDPKICNIIDNSYNIVCTVRYQERVVQNDVTGELKHVVQTPHPVYRTFHKQHENEGYYQSSHH
jgi:hypothetical protein